MRGPPGFTSTNERLDISFSGGAMHYLQALKRTCVFCFLLMLLILVGTGQSFTIILVATNPDEEQPYIEFLEEVFGENVQINAGPYTDLHGNPQMLAELEAADLIVVVRRTNSGNYIDGTEIDLWNNLTTPILCHSAYLTRQNRWNWMAGDRLAATMTHLQVADPQDPIYDGMNVLAGDTIGVFKASTTIDVQENAGNGTHTASVFSTNRVFISRWDNTDVFFHNNSPYKPGGPRLFFGLHEFDSIGPLTEQGRILLKNALLSLTTQYKGQVISSESGLWIQNSPPRSDTFSVLLNEPPAETVYVQVSTGSESERIRFEGATSAGDPITLIFTPSDWDIAQSVTVHANPDASQTGHVQAEIRFKLHSLDARFNGPLIMPVKVTVFDAAANTCPLGDLNGDCLVDIDDLLILAVEWLGAPQNAAPLGDSETIDYANLAQLSQHWLDQSGPVVITEFMASNGSTLLDGNNEASDWIELYNMTDTPVDLEGWYLTDNANRLTKWQFPANTIIEPYGYYLVFASSKDDALYPYADSDGILHTNFSLSIEGEYLGLVAPDGLTIVFEYAPLFPPQKRDMSYGLSEMRPVYFANATPRFPNDLHTYEGIVSELEFSHARGVYTDAFEVSISSDTEGVSIYYTTDGTPPSPASAAYTEPLTISGTTCLRAAAYKPDWYSSVIGTQTYIFLSDVLTQSAPADYPAEWSGFTADYEMDPEVYTDPAYTDLIFDSLVSLPILSIVTDKNNLFDPATGIYQNPVQSTVLWERPISAEFFDPQNPEAGFQIDCGLRIQGGASRQPANTPKHSFRLLFKSIYGSSKLNYPLFGEGFSESFDTLVLRANYNNSWVHWEPAQRLRSQYLRDQWARDTQLAMGHPSAQGLFIHLYINGLYWGLFNIAERPEASFSASYFGGDKTEWDALNKGAVVDGNNIRWNQALSIANAGVGDDAGYAALSQYVNIPNLIDYMIINFYGGNQDWGSNNWYASAKREDGYGFRFYCWDTERTLEDPSGHDVTGINVTNSPARLYAKLRENPEFRMQFADHAHRHLFNNGVLTPDACIARWMDRASQIDLAVIAESTRWGDYRRDVHVRGHAELYTRNIHWIAEQNRLLQTYFPIRTGVLIDQFRNAALYPATEAPVFNINHVYQHGGYVSVDDALSVVNPNNGGTIYYTLDGSDPRLPGGDISSSASVYTTAIPVSQTVLIKARILHNGIWSALNEATYTPGPSELIHYWSFNAVDTLLSPTHSRVSGAATAIVPGAETEIVNSTGQDFSGVNNRLDEPVGDHLRINNPLGSTVTLSLPTTGYGHVALMYETRRSGQGAGQQLISYSLDGQAFVPFEIISLFNDIPVLHTFDFSEIDGVNNNPLFTVKIDFLQADGGTSGNNRFDNITLDGIPVR